MWRVDLLYVYSALVDVSLVHSRLLTSREHDWRRISTRGVVSLRREDADCKTRPYGIAVIEAPPSNALKSDRRLQGSRLLCHSD